MHSALLPPLHTGIFLQIAAAAPAALAPIRIMAGLALAVVIGVAVYVLRHLKKIENEIVADELIPAERGARSNMVFIVCAVTFLVVCLLLFLIFKA
jgi:hypothetical protein